MMVHPGVAEIIALVGGPGSDVISQLKWSVTPQKADKRWHRLYFFRSHKEKTELRSVGSI